MDRLKTPLTAVIVIFICSLVGAVVAFRFLESTATFENNQGLKLGGAIVGFLVTFAALWRAFHTFSTELGKADRERMAEQIKNLQNQLVRQNPAPAGYRRLLSEDFKLVAHVPLDWTTTDNTMIMFAPRNAEAFLDNIVIYRTLARRQHRTLLAQIAKGKVEAEAARNPAQSAEYQKQWDQINRDFLLHRDDPPRADETIDNVLDLEVQANESKIIGVPEQMEVAKYPAIRFQSLSPAADVIGRKIMCLMTEIFVNDGDGYIYQVVLTSTAETVSSRTPVYNKIINSLNFFT